jgi:hypothetical protein
MNKFQIVKQLRNNGDSILTLKDNKESILVTTDFSARYIKRKKSQRFTILKNCILLFSWTDNGFRNIKISDIKNITPLSVILKNPSPEIKIDAEA